MNRLHLFVLAGAAALATAGINGQNAEPSTAAPSTGWHSGAWARADLGTVVRHRGRPEEPERLVRRRQPRAGCGRPRTAATPGRRSSTSAAPTRSAPSTSIRRTPTSSGSAPARTTTSAASRFGDGVYKSTDAGKTWKRMGLENSEHIQNILIDPRNSNVVYVTRDRAALVAGGDRGLYKTTDGGQTWKAVLTISPDTGVTDIVMDPRKPDVALCRGVPAAARGRAVDRRRARERPSTRRPTAARSGRS